MNSVFTDPRIARGMQVHLARRRERCAAGEAPLGWKVGFGAPASMQKLGTDAPLVGYLMRRAVVASGDVVSLKGWVAPMAEPEIAVHMSRDLPGGASEAQVVAAIAGLGPAIELADVEFPPQDVEAILAGNIFQRHVVLGPADASRAGGQVDGLTCRILRNGAEVARTSDPQANTGKLVAIVRHVADVLVACGERLRVGDVIITGSVVAPLTIGDADESIAHEIDPLGTVSVRFSR